MGVPDEIKRIQDEADEWGPLDPRLIEYKIQLNKEAGIGPEKLLGQLYEELRRTQWTRLTYERRIQQITEQISYIERKVLEG